MATHSEIEQWKRFIQGDKDAFRVLYSSFVDVLFAYATRFCSDQATIQDAIHDLFVDLHRYRTNLNPDANVKAYLFSSLRRKVVSSMTKHQGSSLSLVENTVFQLEYNREEQIILDETESEVLSRLRYELDRLTDRQKEALYLRFSSELAYEQVADIMNLSVSSCRTLIYRAVKQLRFRMQDIPISQLLFIAFWKKL